MLYEDRSDPTTEVVRTWWIKDFGGCWKVITRCPLCEKEHGHAINSTDVGIEQHRVADCFRGGYFFTVQQSDINKPEQPQSGKQQEALYPWEKWFDGNIWELSPGTDFDIPVKSFCTQVYQRAKKWGFLVTIQTKNRSVLVQRTHVFHASNIVRPERVQAMVDTQTQQ